MTHTSKPGACNHAMLRIKKWRSGFSIKCMDYSQQNTLMVTPFDEAYLAKRLETFCVGCPALNNQKAEVINHIATLNCDPTEKST